MRTQEPGRLLAKTLMRSHHQFFLRFAPAPRLLLTDRRRFIAALKAELPTALKNLQQGAIAPVDLPQAAIGPGMARCSRGIRKQFWKTMDQRCLCGPHSPESMKFWLFRDFCGSRCGGVEL